jgi:hypothetical protein
MFLASPTPLACLLLLSLAWIAFGGEPSPSTNRPSPLRFDVTLGRSVPARPNPGSEGPGISGRLIVVLGRESDPEPRLLIGRTGLDAAPILGRDALNLAPGDSVTLDQTAAIFPIDRLDQLKPGRYRVQAILHRNRDLNQINAPGDLYGPVRTVDLDPSHAVTVPLLLDQALPEESLPANTPEIQYLKIRSERLTAFHGRPIFLRAGIILPPGFHDEPNRRYPLRIHIGGYGARYTEVAEMMVRGTSFRKAWLAPDAPRMILLHLDGAGPFGDPYQVDSDNQGPYGDALVHELIPAVETRFRGIGTGKARFLDGGSTGGWVSLALQIFYPETFNGAWAACPDSVDFRSFQLVNLGEDANAYINRHGFERPAARDLSGEVRYTMRHECQLENVLGLGDSWTMSGGQWGAWNATYGQRGPDGRPVPLWDPKSGRIDNAEAEHWKRYDLRRILESNWSTLGPRLRGKLHIAVGEADDYFLNNAVHRLDAFLSRAQPPYEGSISYGPGQGHCWLGLSQSQLMREMVDRLNTP